MSATAFIELAKVFVNDLVVIVVNAIPRILISASLVIGVIASVLGDGIHHERQFTGDVRGGHRGTGLLDVVVRAGRQIAGNLGTVVAVDRVDGLAIGQEVDCQSPAHLVGAHHTQISDCYPHVGVRTARGNHIGLDQTEGCYLRMALTAKVTDLILVVDGPYGDHIGTDTGCGNRQPVRFKIIKVVSRSLGDGYTILERQSHFLVPRRDILSAHTLGG